MPHTYDTGLATSQRTKIRRAVVSRLEQLTIANGLYAAAVKSVIGPIGAEDGDLVMEATNSQLPALLVALGRKSYAASGTTRQKDQWLAGLELQVYFVNAHRRDNVARMEGDVASEADVEKDPGLDAMMEHVEELLLGHQITDASRTIYQITPVEEDLVAHFDEFTLWRQRYQVQVERVLRRDKTVTQLVESIKTSINIPELDDVVAPLTEIP